MKIVNEQPLESRIKVFIYIQIKSKMIVKGHSRFSLDINQKTQE